MAQIDIELVNVSKQFGTVAAVDDVSFSIEKGEFFSLLGPSGCGKTTLLRLLSGFERPTKGEVYIDGKRMTDTPPYMRPTNLVFQQLSLFPHMNVFKNIAFGLEMKGVTKPKIRKSVREMLSLVQLEGFEDRSIRQLSGGQQQRVAIARALVNKPTVVLLDEPLGSLDLKLRNQMQLELKRIQEEVGTTFVYVTHDQGEAITMSDSIAVMCNGRIQQIGKSDDIYENPKTKFVASFIGETNLIKAEVRKFRDNNCEVSAKDLILKVRTDQPVQKGQEVYISLRPEKIQLAEKLDQLDNILDAKVTNIIYQGLMSLYTVEIENCLKLSVILQNIEIRKELQRGSMVQVGWRTSNGVLITES